jgi:hypothetical protein
MSKSIKLHVDCYSGHTARERPVRFAMGEKNYNVTDLIDRWYGPDYLYFKVRADDGNIYILKCDEINDEWVLEYFKKTDESSV